MNDLEDFLWGFSIISLALCFLRRLRKAISMASLSLTSPQSSSPPPPLSWEIISQSGDMKSTGLGFEEKIVREGLRDKSSQKNSDVLIKKLGPDSLRIVKIGEGDRGKGATKLKKRPGKKGRREIMEDGYGTIIDILGDAKQAFFAVIDGHGGRAAAEYVAENLGKNIVKGLQNVGCKEDGKLEEAIRGGYLVTDSEFLSQGVSSGACAASVLLKDGELHAANVGDCRVVLSRNGIADVLTNDHRASREDERLRIENSGGFLHCRNGIWRVHGSLAVSRAIGDRHLKEWIISEPEIKRVPLTSDCQFLIMASDGLWDKVDEQEAVDVILRENNSVESCKKLVDKSFSRGNMDDITVMVINLQNFVTNGR
ncbi:hypothetical protein OIU84_017419 [Salix udensis]|uniref:PPM-type phosphatase domain-containing protein n=1 Tax=Salix udensis TaxID=889485 RepID=A0AAD6L1X5_9ROSI|nr:hypothetical protein OIU84_017419 [Salix udensis]